ELPGPGDRIVDFPKGKGGCPLAKGRGRILPTVVDWRTNDPKDGMPAEGTYSIEAVRALDTHRTPIQKQPEMLLCVVRISRRYYLGDEVYGSIQLNSCPKSYKGVNDQDPLSFADPPAHPPADVTQSSQGIAAAGDPASENASSPAELRLRFEQEAKLLRKSVAQVARRDRRIQARELEIKNLEALLEAEANTKKVVEDRSAGLSQELENMCAQFSDLQVSNKRLSQQVATLQKQVSGKEKLKAAFEEFKRQQDERVEQRCVEMDALSIDFDEELYPHMLTAIASRRWVIGRGLRLAVMKCGESLELRQAFADAVSAEIAKGLIEGLRHGLEHGQAQRSLESIEASDGVPVSAPTVVPQGLALLLADAATRTEFDDA
nr:hypothetical protein [Tanacetum cinerariifolium]